MKGEQLRERVVAALQRSQVLTLQADDVLAALGLDDLDAAVRRAARVSYAWRYGEPGQTALGEVRATLEAALTPPETVAKTERDDR